MKRRTRLVAVSVALLAFSGAYLAGNPGFAAADHHEVFSVRQNGQCYEVTPYGDGSQTVESFYDYRRGPGTQYSSYGTTHLQANQVSRLFVYRGSGGTSLVMLHDRLGGEDGGAITFQIRGLPAGDWAVIDDTYDESDDRVETFSGGANIDWMWSDNRTDGAAFRGIESHGYDAITIDPYFNGESWAANGRNSRWPYADDQVSWQLISADGSAAALDRTQPIEIRPGPCQVETTTTTTTTATTTSTTTTSTTTETTSTTTATTTATTVTTTTQNETTIETTTETNETTTETTTTETTTTETTTTETTTTETTTTETTTEATTTETTTETNDNDDGGSSGSSGGSSGGGTRGYNSGGSTGSSEQETLPEMSVDVDRPDDDTALIEVSDPASEDGVEIEPLVSDGPVAYRSLNLSFDASDDFGMMVQASETPPPGSASPAPDRDGFEALSYLSVDSEGMADENVSDAEIAFAVEESLLAERGVAPEEVAVYRRADGEWQPIDTELVDEGDGSYEYVVRSSNLSSMVVAANRPTLSITEVRVREDTIRPGEEVEVEAIVENTGNAAGTASANLTAFGTVVDTSQVRVPAGERRALVFTQRFDSPGEYTVSVAGNEAQVHVESTTSSPTATPTDATTGPGQPGFGLLSALLMMLLIGLVVVYGLRDVV